MSFDFLSFLKGCIGPFGKFAILAVEEDPRDPDVCDVYIAHLPDAPESEDSEKRKMPCFAAWDPEKRILQLVAMLAPEALGLDDEDAALRFANDVNACVNRLFSVSLMTPRMILGDEAPDDGDIGSLRFALSMPIPPAFDDPSSWHPLREMVRQALRGLLLEGSSYLVAADEAEAEAHDPSRLN